MTAGADGVRSWVDRGNAQFIEGLRAGDAALFADCFAEDGAMLGLGKPPVVGRDAVRESLAAAFARGIRLVEGTITTTSLDVIGDLAYERGAFAFTYGSGSLPRRSLVGTFLEIWRRQPDGSWKMWRDISLTEEEAGAAG